MEHEPADAKNAGAPYARLAGTVVLSFAAMYVLMYAMVDSAGNLYGSLNEFYMAGLMAMPMAAIELVLMRSMYPDRRINAILIAAALVLMAGFWLAIRQQAFVSDRQFLRSMIPHHAGAILMCRQAALRDPDLRTLCDEIVESQQREIERMKAKLR